MSLLGWMRPSRVVKFYYSTIILDLVSCVELEICLPKGSPRSGSTPVVMKDLADRIHDNSGCRVLDRFRIILLLEYIGCLSID